MSLFGPVPLIKALSRKVRVVLAYLYRYYMEPLCKGLRSRWNTTRYGGNCSSGGLSADRMSGGLFRTFHTLHARVVVVVVHGGAGGGGCVWYVCMYVLYVCMYVCIMYACMYVYMYVCMCMNLHM